MSIAVLTSVWKHSRQRAGALLVLLAIADFADDDGVAFPSIERLAVKARLKERQVHNVLQALERTGELEVLPGQGRNHTNLYRILLPKNPANNAPLQNLQGAKNSRKGAIRDTERVQPVAPKPSYVNRHIDTSVKEPTVPIGETRQKRRRRTSGTTDEPKRNWVKETIDAIVALGGKATGSGRDGKALKEADPPLEPSVVADAYVSHRAWAPNYIVNGGLSIHAVVENIGGYFAWVDAGKPQRTNGNHPPTKNNVDDRYAYLDVGVTRA